MNKMIEFVNTHPKTIFWIRFVLWFACACGLPFFFIAWRFELFHSISKLNIGGWGILAIFIVVVFLFVLIRYVKLLFNTKYSLLAQCLNGFCKIILPLLTLLLIFKSSKDNIDILLQVLGVIIVCEAVAIPINPLPKLVYEKQKDVKAEERKETVDYLINSFFTRKSGRH